MEYRVLAGKDTLVEVRLYKEEIVDLVKALDYYMEHVDLKSLNEKEDDKYDVWYKNLRNGLNRVVLAVTENWNYT